MGSSAPPDGAVALAAAAVDAMNESKPVDVEAFSWLDPHPIFVIILVGPEEKPFGIQKDFLCARCRYFRDYFAKNRGAGSNAGEGTGAGLHESSSNGANNETTIEHVVRLPDVAVSVFAYVQHFLYTGSVCPKSGGRDGRGASGSGDDALPAYDDLVGIWKLGHRLGVTGLCERTLEAMAECKRRTQTIPATPLLVQVWKDTPTGSSIRQLLLSWAAEYLRASDDRSDFARSLPQELLSELVVAMSAHGDGWSATTSASDGDGSKNSNGTLNSASNGNGNSVRHKNIHYFSDDDNDAHDGPAAAKRLRYFESYPVRNNNSSGAAGSPAAATGGTSTTGAPHHTGAGSVSTIAAASNRPKAGRHSLPTQRGAPRKRAQVVDMDAFSPSQKLKFCSDLLTRMLSGPGFWTRLVGPFRDPVDPSSEGIPDYFQKVKRPMDLSTIKDNLDNGRYKSQEEFAADMRQIFTNVYLYWKKSDPIWTVCERFEKTFEEKYAQMNKWLGKMDGEDFN
ncbi:transcription regulator [Niveomyces insectorum RCEF 264]|uniref:Transcription regulator n=1 Tax=Niveomyces insectorum RCEF 264 TaxID=1081102 RepID=A0A167MWD0_9HYPO|nr:transcription regulator [Niveomyces insectorum RCEF 264]